jgi:membrane protein required for colicin V production
MIWIDFSIIGLVSIYLLRGLLRGISASVYALINWLLATAIGLAFSRECALLLKLTVTHPSAKIAAAFAILVAITLGVGTLIYWLLGDLIKKRHLTLLDRLGGLIVSMVHSMAIVTVIVMLAGLSVLPHSPWWQKSTLIPPFQTLALGLQHRVHSELTERIRYQ